MSEDFLVGSDGTLIGSGLGQDVVIVLGGFREELAVGPFEGHPLFEAGDESERYAYGIYVLRAGGSSLEFRHLVFDSREVISVLPGLNVEIGNPEGLYDFLAKSPVSEDVQAHRPKEWA